jgi:hypothetical protein
MTVDTALYHAGIVEGGCFGITIYRRFSQLIGPLMKSAIKMFESLRQRMLELFLLSGSERFLHDVTVTYFAAGLSKSIKAGDNWMSCFEASECSSPAGRELEANAKPSKRETTKNAALALILLTSDPQILLVQFDCS